MSDEVRAWVVQDAARELPAALDAPRMSVARGVVVRPLDVVDDDGARRSIQIPVERPLTVVLNGAPLMTLLTLGAAPELLVLGYLRNQRIIDAVRQVDSIAVDWGCGLAEVAAPSVAATSRVTSAADGSTAGAVASACSLGTVFAEVMRTAGARGAAAAARSLQVSRSTLLRVLDTMQTHDDVHRAAGSVHSCALFRGADLLVAIEDISRHNGVDTVVGWMLLHGVQGGDKVLFTTGRLTAEMVMKAAHNDIRVMVSRNGVTAMGYDLAAQLGITLIARAAKRRFTCYLGTVLDD